jgi:Arginine deiminase
LPEDKLNASSFLLAGNEPGRARGAITPGPGHERCGKTATGSAFERNTGTNTAPRRAGIKAITIEGFELGKGRGGGHCITGGGKDSKVPPRRASSKVNIVFSRTIRQRGKRRTPGDLPYPGHYQRHLSLPG